MQRDTFVEIFIEYTVPKRTRRDTDNLEKSLIVPDKLDVDLYARKTLGLWDLTWALRFMRDSNPRTTASQTSSSRNSNSATFSQLFSF